MPKIHEKTRKFGPKNKILSQLIAEERFIMF